MLRLNQILVISLTILAFASCNNDKVVHVEENKVAEDKNAYIPKPIIVESAPVPAFKDEKLNEILNNYDSFYKEHIKALETKDKALLMSSHDKMQKNNELAREYTRNNIPEKIREFDSFTDRMVLYWVQTLDKYNAQSWINN